MTRATATLLGAAVAGFLLWIAAEIGFDGGAEYWAALGVLAGAGLVLAASQLLGGWTKWGMPRVSRAVLLLGFVPALLVGGWLLAAAQPNANSLRNRVLDWSDDVGLLGLVTGFEPVVTAIALGLGLLLGLSFDTTGPRGPVETVRDHEDERVADEPLAAEREETLVRR
jgi:hypothetical protein